MADDRRKVITADVDQMTPQERADAVDARGRRDWDEVDEEFKERVLARARDVAAQRRTPTL